MVKPANLSHVLLVAASLLAIGGCYTRFATFEAESVTPKADTLRAADKETCIWERDLTGYPSLHCYPPYYPRQWYLYQYAPWWYHSDRHLYTPDKCPPYYYYDPNCGCCRYYLNNPDLARGAAGGGDAGKTEKPPADGNNISISGSSHTRIFIPLQGNATPAAGAPQQSAGQSSSAAAQTGQDSLSQQRKNDSAAAHDTAEVAPVKKLNRSLRSR
jgi:hypothetical protein